MDEDLFFCEICTVSFYTEASPRMLPCGHSCCTSCVKKLILTNKKCHVCKISLTEDDVRKYPVNYSLLRVQREIAIGFSKAVVAVARLNGEEKFAKMQINDGKLFLHALDKWDGINGNITKVDFQDLQEHLLPMHDKLYGFLLLDYDPKEAPFLAVIELFNTTTIVQGIQFLKLCSGELGTSYKGLSCCQEMEVDGSAVLKVKSFAFQTKDKYPLFNGRINDNDRNITYCKWYLTFPNDGSFELHYRARKYDVYEDMIKCTIQNCIGIVANCKLPLHGLENVTVLDCGIALQLPA